MGTKNNRKNGVKTFNFSCPFFDKNEPIACRASFLIFVGTKNKRFKNPQTIENTGFFGFSLGRLKIDLIYMQTHLSI